MREQAQTLPRLGDPDRPATVARRLGRGNWRNGRLALGVLLVLAAVLGGAAILRQADRTIPVLAAARDLPSGVTLRVGDLRPVQVRLPAEQLARYARPGNEVLGGRLAGSLPEDALVPLALLAQGPPAANLVEYPIPVEVTAMPGGLRPGDRVAVVVAGGEPDGRGLVLLPSVEVLRLLRGGGGFDGADSVLAVEVRMPKDRLALVAGAIASGRVSLARLATGDLLGVDGGGPTAGPAGATGSDPDAPAGREAGDGRSAGADPRGGTGSRETGEPDPEPGGGGSAPGSGGGSGPDSGGGAR